MSNDAAPAAESIFSVAEAIFKEWVVDPISATIFFDLWRFDNAAGDAIQVPAVVVWLVFGALFFTLRFQFVNVRGFRHGIDCVRGIYSDPNEAGEITHFQALSAALSATVGLGNIAGVAIAIAIGGPGAVFWMWVVGILGMAIKTTEVTQSMLFRDTSDPDNPHGGPMFVVKKAMGKWGDGWPQLGTIIGGIFCLTLLISADRLQRTIRHTNQGKIVTCGNLSHARGQDLDGCMAVREGSITQLGVSIITHAPKRPIRLDK